MYVISVKPFYNFKIKELVSAFSHKVVQGPTKGKSGTLLPIQV